MNTLFLASPIAWKGTLAQYAGRLHREYSGKQDAMIYDYVDIHVPVLERMYHKRLSGYAQIGYKVLAARNEPDKISMIYDTDSFVTVIQKPNIHRKYIIIDNCLVWYGSINLLSYGISEESIMRLESRELAEELDTMTK